MLLPETTPVSRLNPYRIPAFVLSVILLVGVGVAMVMSIRSFSQSTDLVERSHQVIRTAETVRSSIRAAESDARGYRLSGQEPLLAEYIAVDPLARNSAAQLVNLTMDDLIQQNHALELETLIDTRLGRLQQLIEVQHAQGREEAQRQGTRGPGAGLTRQIDALINTMLTRERELLRQRRETMGRLALLTTIGVVVGILMPLAMLGVLLVGLARENRRGRKLEIEARDTLRELALSLEQRSRLSEQRRVLGAYAGILQSCENLEEALDVSAEVIAQMLPGAGGRFHAVGSSMDQVEALSDFGVPAIASEPIWAPSACWALRRGQSHRSGKGPGNVYCSHLDVDSLPPDGWTLCVPLMAQGTSLGLLHISATQGGGSEDVQMVEAIAEQLSLAMINLQLRESLRIQSIRDPLTGLYNRRYLEENIQREMQRCQRRELPLSVIMLDIDHFKHFNDQHGHGAGDAMLAAMARTLQAHTRDEDIVCRHGGEEFIVVMPETSSDNAHRRAEEIRSAIAATTVVYLRKTLGPNTASLGVATFPLDGSTPAELIGFADTALYRAKAEGRNRVVVHRAMAG